MSHLRDFRQRRQLVTLDSQANEAMFGVCRLSRVVSAREILGSQNVDQKKLVSRSKS